MTDDLGRVISYCGTETDVCESDRGLDVARVSGQINFFSKKEFLFLELDFAPDLDSCYYDFLDAGGRKCGV